ncbi:MAG TPA: AgmX/PglI C-terminal domain-containing protein, partial [Polyangiales bacterium]|nr:AgmX/PglI C-terminal domain-containing protein [Polyangiales bacterium]
MEPLTLELFRCLQSEPYDESGLSQIRSLLSKQRGLARAKRNLSTLADLIPLLEDWASAAGPGRVASDALLEAADIAEKELGKHDLATRLRTSAAAQSGGDRSINSAAAYIALARRRSDAGDIDGAIDAYEHALSLEAELATVRQLADLFAKRAAPGDAAQSADLYFTLADVLGNPDGIAMLERAVAQQPGHRAASDLLASFRAKSGSTPNEMPATKPKLPVLLGERPVAPIAITTMPKPPSALGGQRRNARKRPPPLAAKVAVSNAPGVIAAPVSSLTPVVRQDVVTLEDEPQRSSKRWIAVSGGLVSIAAAAAVFFLAPIRSGRTDVPPPMAALAAKPAPLPLPPPPAPAAETPKPSAANSGAGSAAPAPATAAAPAAAAEAAPEPTAAEKPSELKPTVELLFDAATIRGGKLTSAQLSSAFANTTPKLERCYVQVLKKKPKTKGRLTFSWTVKPNGRVVALKKLSDTVNDPLLAQCSQQA